MRVFLFFLLLLHLSFGGCCQHKPANNKKSEPSNAPIDSICKKEAYFKYCYYVTEDNLYYLKIFNDNGVEDSIQMHPFVWSNGARQNVFYFDSTITSNIINIDDINFFLVMPIDIGYVSLVKIKKINNSLFIDKKFKVFESEIPIIYDKENNIICKPIVRGENMGKVELWRINSDTLKIIGVFETKEEITVPYSRKYINKVIGIIN